MYKSQKLADVDVQRIQELGRFVRQFKAEDAVRDFKPFTLEVGDYKEV